MDYLQNNKVKDRVLYKNLLNSLLKITQAFKAINKNALSGLRQFLATESPLKMM